MTVGRLFPQVHNVDLQEFSQTRLKVAEKVTAQFSASVAMFSAVGVEP